ncbi:Orf15 [Heliothis zea nudivirus]|uniref:Orf15 n=1 Tax=Heliothis zea nudivirus 1 TaxID=3116536 RepID=Q8JKU6_9VIRU|nr:Orf15 [Heliothis zea nudivirus]AAN04310.1 Orf15 [Heliothis zea nudivirus]
MYIGDTRQRYRSRLLRGNRSHMSTTQTLARHGCNKALRQSLCKANKRTRHERLPERQRDGARGLVSGLLCNAILVHRA